MSSAGTLLEWLDHAIDEAQAALGAEQSDFERLFNERLKAPTEGGKAQTGGRPSGRRALKPTTGRISLAATVAGERDGVLGAIAPDGADIMSLGGTIGSPGTAEQSSFTDEIPAVVSDTEC